jgi:hypothetical protein
MKNHYKKSKFNFKKDFIGKNTSRFDVNELIILGFVFMSIAALLTIQLTK